MPYVLEEGIVVPTETSFMIVGEIVFSDAREQILEFHPVNMDWILREETMEVGIYGQFIIGVDREKFCSTV